MRRSLALALTIALLPGVVVAQSPGPSGAPGAPADCADLELFLPDELDGLDLTAEVASGVDGFDPDDMLDPFLGPLGLARDDVCSVGIRYAGPATELIGLLVRVRGAGPALADRLAGALAERLRAYGNEVATETTVVAGAAVPLLRIVAAGSETQLLVVDARDDTVLIATSPELPEALLPFLPEPSMTPTASPTPAGSN